jgi:hypothetical protein
MSKPGTIVVDLSGVLAALRPQTPSHGLLACYCGNTLRATLLPGTTHAIGIDLPKGWTFAFNDDGRHVLECPEHKPHMTREEFEAIMAKKK